MARERFFLFAMNGGMVSPLALARTDLARMRLTAETFHNCFPRVIGPMAFRPGLEYLGTTFGSAKARKLPFIFSATDTAEIELTDARARFLVDGVPVTRVAHTSFVLDGDFSVASANWDFTGCSGGGVADIDSTVADHLYLYAPNLGSVARAQGYIIMQDADAGKVVGLRINIARGKARIRLGTANNGFFYSDTQENLDEAEYGEGISDIAFTPIFTLTTARYITITIFPVGNNPVHIDSISLSTPGDLTIPAPWDEDHIFGVRYDQSGDVIFAVHGSYNPVRIERRGSNESWAIVKYQFEDGPFDGKTAEVSLNPTTRHGRGTLAASSDFFEAGHVGALFELTHKTTNRSRSISGDDQFTGHVRIAGLKANNSRKVTYDVSGTWVGTLTIQVSHDQGDNWYNYDTLTSNPAGPVVIEPGTDNTIVFVRIGFHTGDYTSGTASVTLYTSRSGGGSGILRITEVASGTSASYEVLEELHGSGKTNNWQEGKYSPRNGWPTAVAFFDGRLWFGGEDQIAGSYSDDFTNFDVNEEGDAAPIVRSIATGPVNKVQWLLGLARLVIGTSGAESVARSTSFDEPMTPSNFSIKDASTYGSADIQGVKVDRSGVFVGRSGKRSYDMSYSLEAQDYSSSEITRYNPQVLAAGVVTMAVQRNPDTRIWYVLADGGAAVLTYEKSEDVISWSTFETDGVIEDVIVLPNTESDDVHFVVRRIINGSTVRYREKLAYEENAMGGNDNYMADSFVIRDIVGTATVTGLTHLALKNVVVWANGAPILDADNNPQTFAVSAGGQIVLPFNVTGRVIVGLSYEGLWKSTKLAYAAQSGTAMSQKKIINEVAPILYSTHIQGVLFGSSFSENMDPVPQVQKMEDLGANTLLAEYDYDAFTLPGQWSNDSRLCLKFRAPLPATVLGVGMLMESHERS